MFKRRIHKWKLDKNNKQHEMKAVVHLAEERRRQGKARFKLFGYAVGTYLFRRL